MGIQQRDALRRATHLRQALEHLRAAVPARAEGCDVGGRVRVVLGPDGLPVEIRALAGGGRAPGGFGAAVEEAFAAASSQRLRTGPDDPAPGGPAPPPDPVPARPGTVRPVGEIAEDVIAALHEAVRIGSAPAEQQGVGSAASGRLVLLLSYGAGVRCSVDPEWVAGQSAASLDAALAAALRDARAVLARGAVPPGRPWDGLLAEARSAVTDITRAE